MGSHMEISAGLNSKLIEESIIRRNRLSHELWYVIYYIILK